MHLLLYDGVCGLCNRLVRFVLDRDRKDVFRFASLQSDLAARVLAKYGRDPRDLDTFYLVFDYGTPGERIAARGRAAIEVLRTLGRGWSLVVPLAALPDALLEFGYDLVAKRRYRWFGKLNACPLPRPADAAKFLDASA